jgi:hypothetical protein
LNNSFIQKVLYLYLVETYGIPVIDGIPMQPLVTIGQLWALATTWYPNRLQADSRRPQLDEMRQIFAGIGLGDDFWDLQADRFG